MVKNKTWEDFRKTGLLWLVNTILHTFGWAIVLYYSGDEIEAYPARCNFRGFPEEINTEGYIKISDYMKENAEVLAKEARE